MSMQLAWNLNDTLLEQKLCNNMLASSYASSSKHGLPNPVCNCKVKGNPKKLWVAQLVKNFQVFCETWRLIAKLKKLTQPYESHFHILFI